MTVTHCDGFPVVPVSTDALLIGMGERFDAVLILGDGVFPLVASAEGKSGQGQALIRTTNGAAPAIGTTVPELARRVLLGTDVTASPEARLPKKPVDRRHDVALGGTMNAYRWTINGRTFAVPSRCRWPRTSGCDCAWSTTR
jgi:FtsP/CotA-like multicopper oxidase with cupredoxin domain